MMSDEAWQILCSARREIAELVASRSYLPDVQILFMLDRAILMDPRAQEPGPAHVELEPEPEIDEASDLRRQAEQDSKIINGLRKELAALRKRLARSAK